MNQCNEVDYFNRLLNNYIVEINKLVEYIISLKILSAYMVFLVPQFKKYIENNKIDILQNCIQNIDEFKNFSLDDFSEMDDNQSYNAYMPKIQKNKQESQNSTQLFNFLLEIKNKSNELSYKSKKSIQKKISKIVDILNKIDTFFIENC